MFTKIKQLGQTATLMLVPFIVGCNGVAQLSSLGSLFGGSGGDGDVGAASALLPSGGEAGIATLVNPEPASMLLVGSGMAALAFFGRKIKKDT